MPTDSFSSLAAQLDTWEKERDLSGSILLTRRGETLFEQTCGYADRATGARITPATRFGLASVTKMFTAAAVADLVNAGSLSFDSAVVDLLPAERRPSTLLREVTLHHLLSHTFGIADYCEEDEDSPNHVEDYGSLWVDRPTYSMQRPADYLPMFGDLLPYRPPGEQYQYSNAGYVLLGLVIEEVAGRAYTEVVQERVFARAGMEWSADGGSHSTPRDIDRFLHAHADGSLLGESQERFLERQADASEGYFEDYGVLYYPDGRYGHGGWDPGVMAIANRWPAEDVHVVVLCNGEGLAGEVRDLAMEAAGLSQHA